MALPAVRVVLKRLACIYLVVFFLAMYFSRHHEQAKMAPVRSQVRSHYCTFMLTAHSNQACPAAR